MVDLWPNKKFSSLAFWKKPKENSSHFFPDIQTYLENDLRPRLGLFNLKPFPGHYQNAIANTPSGQVFLNFFPQQTHQRVHCITHSHALMKKHGISVPEIVHVDGTPQTLNRYNLSCLVTRWISGKTLLTAAQSTKLEAFKILAKINTIDGTFPVTNQDPTNPLPAFSAETILTEHRLTSMDPLSRTMISNQKIQQVFSFLDEGLARIFPLLPDTTLLHRDFHPGNLILTDAGNIVTLDLEVSALGPFCFDLGKSLIKFCFKSHPREFNKWEIEELPKHPILKQYVQAYSSMATQRIKDLWVSYDTFFLFLAYLKIISQLTNRIHALPTQERKKIRKLSDQLRHRWQAVTQYVDRHSGNY